MMDGDMLIIQVPASTANLGPGFDSIGLALNLYLRLEVEKSDRWEMLMQSEELDAFPKDEANFIIQIALQTAKKYNKTLQPCRIKMSSEIPLARGLGSSAAAIVAGIELANVVGKLHLTKAEKFQFATEIEGHPDNVGPSLFGGLVIGCKEQEEVHAVVNYDVQFDCVVAIPKEELLTKEARGVLPEELSFGQSVQAGAVANVMIAALLTGDYQLAGKMMKKDLYHQPYRRKLVPHLELLEAVAYKEGAFGVALSGAGPTVLCCCEQGQGKELVNALQKLDPKLEYFHLEIDKAGSQVTMESHIVKK